VLSPGVIIFQFPQSTLGKGNIPAVDQFTVNTQLDVGAGDRLSATVEHRDHNRRGDAARGLAGDRDRRDFKVRLRFQHGHVEETTIVVLIPFPDGVQRVNLDDNGVVAQD